MRVAVINFSGNVGKSTVARHLLLPRIQGAELIAIESVNSQEGRTQALRGRQFGELQEYLQTVHSAVIDVGASNIEDFLDLMKRYHGSHEDFDYFIVPAVPATKQQIDTIATLIELSRLGVPASRIKVVFNMVEYETPVRQCFEPVLAFVAEHPVAQGNPACWLGTNEIYARARSARLELSELIRDDIDYKALIAQADTTADKLALAQKLATRRLAVGVVPELDACFAALDLQVRASRAGCSAPELSSLTA